MTASLVAKLAVAAVLSIAVVEAVPRTVAHEGGEPPVRALLVTAALVGLVSVGALLWGMRSDLRLPWKIAVYAVGFNVLVIVVKFALAPHGFYDVNQTEDIDSTFAIDNGPMAVLAAAFIFALYALAYVVLYRFFRRRIAHLKERDPLASYG